MLEAIDAILAGDYDAEDRQMLEATFSRGKSRGKQATPKKKTLSRWKRLWFDALEDRLAPATWIAQGPSPAQNGQVENISPNGEVTGAMHTIDGAFGA